MLIPEFSKTYKLKGGDFMRQQISIALTPEEYQRAEWLRTKGISTNGLCREAINKRYEEEEAKGLEALKKEVI